MEKFDDTDATYRPGGPGVPPPARPPPGLGGPELYQRIKVERELYVMKMYMTWGAILELFLFVAGVMMFFGNTESDVAAMVFFHLPHAVRPFIMGWFMKRWLRVQHIVDGALFDAADAVALLKKSKKFFGSLARPAIVIIVLTSFATVLDFIHMMIRWFSFRSVIDFENKPPKLYLLMFSMIYLFMDAFMFGWFFGLKYTVQRKYFRLLTRALKKLLGRGGDLVPPTPRTGSPAHTPNGKPRNLTNFRHGGGEGIDEESGKVAEDSDAGQQSETSGDESGSGGSSSGSGSSGSDSDGGTTDDGEEAPRPNAGSRGPPPSHAPPPAIVPPSFVPSPSHGSADSPNARPSRLPPLERRGVPRVFSPKGVAAPPSDASDPSDAGYLSNIPGPAVGSTSPARQRRTSDGAAAPVDDSGYKINA